MQSFRLFFLNVVNETLTYMNLYELKLLDMNNPIEPDLNLNRLLIVRIFIIQPVVYLTNVELVLLFSTLISASTWAIQNFTMFSLNVLNETLTYLNLCEI